MRKLDGLRRSASGETIDGERSRVGLEPGRAFRLQKIEVLQRGSRDQRTVDRMECDAMLERVRSRLARMRLRQLILRMRERMQLRRLLGEQHHCGQQQALQHARALIEEKRHIAILVYLDEMRYLTRHCFSP